MSKYNIGVDIASGEDKSCYTLLRKPGRIRRFLRWLKLDRSNWEYRIEEMWYE